MTFNMKIVPLGQRAGYLEARKLVSERGMRLPSNAMHDEYLLKPDRWAGEQIAYPACQVWAREILVHPEKDGKFKKGKDVVDSETGWVLPGNYLADPRFIEADAFRKGVGLFIDPEDFIEDNSKTVVVPASIALLHPFIQIGGGMGKVEEITRVPLDLVPRDEQEKRWLYRKAGVSVRPLIRGCDGCGDWRRNVASISCPGTHLGVIGEATEGSTLLSMTKNSEGELVVRGTPEQIDAAVRLLHQLEMK